MYTLQVKVASYLVGGYPLLVHASPAAFHPPSCGVEMSTSVYKGEENSITITPCDRFGNIVQLPSAPSLPDVPVAAVGAAALAGALALSVGSAAVGDGIVRFGTEPV